MNNNPIKVIHVAGSVSREAGGLFESVRHLSQETSRHGISIRILSTEDAFTEEDLPRWAPMPVTIYPIFGPRRFAWAPDLARHLLASDAEIVHLHGVWQYPTVAVLRWARRTGRPYLVSPHGMLEPWALKHSPYRKAIANWLFQHACLTGAACLRATAELEMESIRQAGLRNSIALIPNGVPFPAVLPPRAPRAGATRKRALFVSRIHPKKGLLSLVSAWHKILKSETGKQVASEWELVLVGPNEGGHLEEVMGAVRACGLEQHISYLGEIWDADAKLECYVNADLFVLPTFSENFGLVIAEALSCAVPVITTRAAPWEELETHQCGWWIDTGEEPLIQALQAAFATPVDTLREMGRRGRQLIGDKYSWARPGQQMAEVYEWLAGRRSRPDCVF
jgi:glycosyltransferase involved in cell wall biosynthesis